MSTGETFSTISRSEAAGPERKYETVEPAGQRGVVAAAGAILAHVILLVKSIAFASPAEAGGGVPSASPQEDGDGTSGAEPDGVLLSGNYSTAASAVSDAANDTGGAARPDPGAAAITRDDTISHNAELLPGPQARAHAINLPVPLANDNTSLPASQIGVIGSSQAATATDLPSRVAAGSPGASSGASLSDDEKKRNQAPVTRGPVQLDDLLSGQTLLIALSSLLAGTSDADGDTLAVSNLSASSGSLIKMSEGVWEYRAPEGGAGEVQFSYVISDGIAAVQQSALLSVGIGPASQETTTGTSPSPAGGEAAAAGTGTTSGVVDPQAAPAKDVTFILGTDLDDVLIGTQGNDVIVSGDGNDTISAGDGDDLVDAGTGSDVVDGGAGSDDLRGGAGDDTLTGGRGEDLVSGGEGNDTFVATAADGNDRYDGGPGSDTIDMAGVSSPIIADLSSGHVESSQTGADTTLSIENIITGTGDDVVQGDTASNSIVTGNGADTVDGGTGDDVLTPGAGDDDVQGGAGNDRIVATEADGNDRYDGGSGIDTLDLSATATAVMVDLDAGTADGTQTGHDTLVSIENVEAGSGDDVIVANGVRNELTGGDGDDTFSFQTADDTPATPEHWDRIRDFEVGDKIDVKKIDADEGRDGDQDFQFLGERDHFEKAGELRFKREKKDDGDHTYVLGNCDDDLDEDFVIDVLGWHELSKEDFHGLS